MISDSAGGFGRWDMLALPVACTLDARVSIVNGGALRGMFIVCEGTGGGDSPRFSVSFRIRIDPNSLGKSDVKVDLADDWGEYGLCPAEEVGLTDRGRVGAPRPLSLVGEDAGTSVVGVNGGVLVANVPGSRRCLEYIA